MVDAKDVFLEKVFIRADMSEGARVLDLGSGRSKHFFGVLKRHPKLTYVGVEPRAVDRKLAQETLSEFPNVRFYARDTDMLKVEDGFDVVLSLSVLEHVKQLPQFIQNSARAAKRGGLVVHRYDLGHALHPSSRKEWFQVWLGNNLPALLPEQKFVRYVDPNKVAELLEMSGTSVERLTYHQMPNHKRFLNTFQASDTEAEELTRQLSQWEFAVSPYLHTLPPALRVSLFPTVALWAVKR